MKNEGNIPFPYINFAITYTAATTSFSIDHKIMKHTDDVSKLLDCNCLTSVAGFVLIVLSVP